MPQALGKWALFVCQDQLPYNASKQNSCQQCLLSKVAEYRHTKKFVKKGIELIGNPAPCIDISSWSTLQECFYLLFSNIWPGGGKEEQGWMGSARSLNPVPMD